MHAMQRRALGRSIGEQPRYLEPVAPVIFPEEEKVPESQRHFDLRWLLYQLLLDHLGPDSTVGSDQFVYFDAADPRRSLAPDVYVRLAPRGEPIGSWKTWERGAPEIAVEFVSDDDRSPQVWSNKLRRYHQMGVNELVRFDPEPSVEPKLRIWNRVDGALVERMVSNARAPSLIFEMHWLLAPAPVEGHAIALRVAAGTDGEQLLPTRLEARAAEAEARAVEAQARAAETEARLAAEARIRELEAELARRSRE
jgi:Uma2 family endonuclease